MLSESVSPVLTSWQIFEIYINCLLDTTIWIIDLSNLTWLKHLILLYSPATWTSPDFHILVNDTATHLAAETKNLEIILISSLPLSLPASALYFLLQSISSVPPYLVPSTITIPNQVPSIFHLEYCKKAPNQTLCLLSRTFPYNLFYTLLPGLSFCKIKHSMSIPSLNPPIPFHLT